MTQAEKIAQQNLRARIEYLKSVISDLEEESIDYCMRQEYGHVDKLTEKISELNEELYAEEEQLIKFADREQDNKNLAERKDQEEKLQNYKIEFDELIERINKSEWVMKTFLPNRTLPLNLFILPLTQQVMVCNKFVDAHDDYRKLIVKELKTYLDNLLDKQKWLDQEGKPGMALVIKGKQDFMRQACSKYYKDMMLRYQRANTMATITQLGFTDENIIEWLKSTIRKRFDETKSGNDDISEKLTIITEVLNEANKLYPNHNLIDMLFQ